MLSSPKLWTLHHLVQHKLLNLNRLICNFPFQLVVGHDNGNAIFFTGMTVEALLVIEICAG